MKNFKRVKRFFILKNFSFLQASFARGHFVVIDVASDSHFEASGEGFEDAFYLVVLVFAFGTDVEVHAGCIAQRLEEVQEHFGGHFAYLLAEEHFGGHFAYLLAVERGVPYQPGTSAEIKRHLAQAIVHGQAVSVAFDTPLASQRLIDALTQGDGGIFYRMMFVYV